eukprot:scaffold4148_cov240-Pinguiococcus_pyrenoidosus.AAC.9
MDPFRIGTAIKLTSMVLMRSAHAIENLWAAYPASPTVRYDIQVKQAHQLAQQLHNGRFQPIVALEGKSLRGASAPQLATPPHRRSLFPLFPRSTA